MEFELFFQFQSRFGFKFYLISFHFIHPLSFWGNIAYLLILHYLRDATLAVALYRELEWTGSFESSDERLNRIWKTGAYTVLLNMQDYIYDGAKRDRLPWMGDLNPELRTILAVFSDTSLVRRTLDYLKKQTPLPGWMNGIVTYSLWFIISHWEYYRHTGDRNYLAAQKGYIDELLKHFAGMIAPGGAEQIVGRRFLD